MALNPVTRSDAAALIPEDVSRSIIQDVPKASIVLSNPLVNQRTMSRKQQRLPILSMLPNAYWVNPSDTGTKQQTRMAWTNKYIEAEELAVIVPIPEAVLEDADYDIWAEVRPRLVEAFGVAIDLAILWGQDAPASFPECLSDGCDRTDNEVKAGVGVDFAEDVNLAMGKVEADGFVVNGHVARVGMKSRLRGLRDQNDQPIYLSSVRADGGVAALYDEPIRYAENGAWDPTLADMITGDWSQLFVGKRTDMRYKILTEATIGGVNLAETDQIALRAYMRIGWQLANPVTRENPNDATRYPFAALRPSGWVGSAGALS